MLSSIFLKTLRDMRGALLWWVGGLGLICLWMVSLFPFIATAPGIEDYLNALPKEMMAMFGASGALPMTSFGGFLTIELMSAFLPALFLTFAINFGASLLSREEDGASLDMLLSNPVARWRVALEKFAALIVFTLAVTLAIYASLTLGPVVFNVDSGGAHVLDGILSLGALTLFFAALAFCLTCLKRARGLATGVSAGLAVVTFFTNGMRDLANLPEWTAYLSPWYYYGGGTVLKDGIVWEHFALLVGLSVAMVALGLWGFNQRDLGT